MFKRATSEAATNSLLNRIQKTTSKGSKPLSEANKKALIQMLAFKSEPEQFEIDQLIPEGTYIKRLCRHFADTDISYELPIFHVIAVASSFLTQGGARLEVPGVGDILPTLWLIGLASSGSSKTLAISEIDRIMEQGSTPLVRKLATGCTDAEWIIELCGNNGAFWFQDEVGKEFAKYRKPGPYSRIKDWVLNAYSHQEIANRLKSDVSKLSIAKPFFTFHGLTVDETWCSDIDITSMLDGFAQRFCYYFATPRKGTDMFDHLLYFKGESYDDQRKVLAELWDALCSQKAACDKYTLGEDVIPYLERWWLGLRQSWGNSSLPKSFIRRIGFAVFRYLIVIQFLLGKSHHPIDLETAEIATSFAEFHLHSTLSLVQMYNTSKTSNVQLVASKLATLNDNGKPSTVRDVTRSMSANQRQKFSKGELSEIVSLLKQIEHMPPLFEKDDDLRTISSALIIEKDREEKKMKLNQRKRNERRLRDLVKKYRRR
nr:hypothetical protein [uncultured Cohaesibacter sp.]